MEILMITNSEIKIYFFQEATSIDLMALPFFVAEEGVDIGQPEQNGENLPNGAYSPIFSTGVRYGPREVSIDIHITNFEHSAVAALYQYIERLNLLSQYVTHPLMALYIKVGDETVAATDHTYGGYLKVLKGSIESSNQLFSVASVYNQDVIGQPATLKFSCDPFFYKHNPLENTMETISISTYDGSGMISGGIINYADTWRPMFNISSVGIEGDVASPAIIRVRSNPVVDSGRPSAIYISSNYNILYPGYGGWGDPTAGATWDDNFSNSFSPTFTDGASIDYRYAGKVMAFLEYTGVTESKLIEVEIRYQGLSYADGIKYFLPYGGASQDCIPMGTMVVPFPGRSISNSYELSITATPAGGTFAVKLVPAWQMRGYLHSGYALAATASLTDNPYDNTVYVDSADGFDGAWYSAIGDPFYLVPGLSQRGFAIAQQDAGGLVWNRRFTIEMYYNPRFLHMRSMVSS
jgi:hypothetical protein